MWCNSPIQSAISWTVLPRPVSHSSRFMLIISKPQIASDRRRWRSCASIVGQDPESPSGSIAHDSLGGRLQFRNDGLGGGGWRSWRWIRTVRIPRDMESRERVRRCVIQRKRWGTSLIVERVVKDCWWRRKLTPASRSPSCQSRMMFSAICHSAGFIRCRGSSAVLIDTCTPRQIPGKDQPCRHSAVGMAFAETRQT